MDTQRHADRLCLPVSLIALAALGASIVYQNLPPRRRVAAPPSPMHLAVPTPMRRGDPCPDPLAHYGPFDPVTGERRPGGYKVIAPGGDAPR